MLSAKSLIKQQKAKLAKMEYLEKMMPGLFYENDRIFAKKSYPEYKKVYIEISKYNVFVQICYEIKYKAKNIEIEPYRKHSFIGSKNCISKTFQNTIAFSDVFYWNKPEILCHIDQEIEQKIYQAVKQFIKNNPGCPVDYTNCPFKQLQPFI